MIQIFFKLVFDDTEGFLGLLHKRTLDASMHEAYFKYPQELDQADKYIKSNMELGDLWFCAQLLNKPDRRKENISFCNTLWSDLDDCDPKELLVKPTVILESSPNRYQGIWKLDDKISPLKAEELSKRIAYYHRDSGADISGWDLTQLLRIPFTTNFKYNLRPKVLLDEINEELIYSIEEFEDKYPEVSKLTTSNIPIPTKLERTPSEILEGLTKNPMIWDLYYKEPTGDWSSALWRLQRLSFESGLDREDVFSLCLSAACNKYNRDNRPKEFLWAEILKAEQYGKDLEENQYFKTEAAKLTLLSNEERQRVESENSLIEEYVEWAETVTDAPKQYHQGCAFMLLSMLLSGNIKLPVDHGMVIPNLWLLILADTTLTRKTTSMKLAMDIANEIDQSLMLATDGSVEGLFSAIAARPNRPSVFLRDEFSGFLEAMVKREYQAGMAETLTKLYDGEKLKRILRRESIVVNDPILLLFAGGIKSRIVELFNYQHVYSGFIPRFIFIQADVDMEKLRPMGPPKETNVVQRLKLVNEFAWVHGFHTRPESMEIEGETITRDRITNAELTPEAWRLFNSYQFKMMSFGQKSDMPELLTPTLIRLSMSALKMAVLLAATKCNDEGVFIDEDDILRAFYYIEKWSRFSLDLIDNLGKTASEKTIELAYKFVKRHKAGCTQSALMKSLKLTSINVASVVDTLEQRNLITVSLRGRGKLLKAIAG